MSDEKPDVFNVGDEFRGYVIERLLGKGGLGAVYLARHTFLDEVYALKILYPHVAKSNESYVKRFLREAKIATHIRHPNLVAVHDCGFDKEHGLYFLVMDYVSGGDLRQAIAFAGRFEPDRAAEVIMQVASALEAAQKLHIVHRDIKPENIMIQPDGLVKLVDLGIAKADDIKDSLNTTTEAVFGTPAYVAPEQAVDAASVDTRADIYSLGIVFFEMIVGHTPFGAGTPPEILAQVLSDNPIPDARDFYKEVDPMLAVLIRRMTVKDKERRIVGPTALLQAFAGLGYKLSRATSSVMPMEEVRSFHDNPTARSVKDVLEKLPTDETIHSHTLTFDTQDAEIANFCKELKRKKVKSKVIRILLFLMFIVGMIGLTVWILL